MRIIFTGISDYKEIKNRIGSGFLTQNFVTIDSANTLMTPDIVSIYPFIYFFEKGKLLRKEKFSIERMNTLHNEVVK